MGFLNFSPRGIIQPGRLALQGLRSNAEHFLSQAFAELRSEMALPAGVGFRVVVMGREQVLKAPLRDEIYRIGREAILNAYRHAHAREIEAAIEYWRGRLRLTVCDDGCGIDPRELRSRQRAAVGFLEMRECADRIGGRLRVSSRVALGTEVELYVANGVVFEDRLDGIPRNSHRGAAVYCV